MPRRGFIKLAAGIFNGLIALALAVPGLGYLFTPLFYKGKETWVKLGAIAKFSTGHPQKAVFKYISESGYTSTEKSAFVWVVANSAEANNLTVLSAVCTHTGCNVSWQSGEKKFVCPCHGGRYDLKGEVISGPPPRPLTTLPFRIENGQLFVQLSL